MNSQRDITVQRIAGNIGAVIQGLDLRERLAPEAVGVVHRAILDHGVIFLRGQDISVDQYWAFMENFGLPMKEEFSGTENDKPADVQAGDLSATRHSTATWHADTTSLAEPPIATALRAVEIPAVGGDTCWSSMYAAWEGLSEPFRRMLDGLTAVHSIDSTYQRMGKYGTGFQDAYGSRHALEQVHPVVLTHPETGRKALYVSETFTTRIVELDRRESDAVLGVLARHIERPEFTVRWKWTPNDMAIWDNRSTQHYAVPDYETTRRMQRIVLSGARPGEPSSLTRAVHQAA